MTILNLKKTNKNYDYVLPLRILSESQYRCTGGHRIARISGPKTIVLMGTDLVIKHVKLTNSIFKVPPKLFLLFLSETNAFIILLNMDFLLKNLAKS